jgi:hypothetical protein
MPYFLKVIERSPPSHRPATTELGDTQNVIEDMLSAAELETLERGTVNAAGGGHRRGVYSLLAWLGEEFFPNLECLLEAQFLDLIGCEVDLVRQSLVKPWRGWLNRGCRHFDLEARADLPEFRHDVRQ